VLRRKPVAGPTLLIVVQLRGGGTIDFASVESRGTWELILSTEDPGFSLDSRPPFLDLSANPPVIRFSRPGGIILREAKK
jgi:hypothetical protein